MAAENLYKKPMRLHIAVNELLVRVHAETILGLVKTVALRELRAKQAQTQALSGRSSSKPAAAAAAAAAAAKVAGTGGPSASALAVQAQAASVAPFSLAAQIEAMHAWARDMHAKARLAHAHVTRLTASTSGWLTGGERGQLAACVRQLQLECAPGIMLPVPMNEGFMPPSATVTAMQSTDEFSDALGWQQAGAGGGEPGDRGRGTFSVMICLPIPPDESGTSSGSSAAQPRDPRNPSFAESVSEPPLPSQAHLFVASPSSGSRGGFAPTAAPSALAAPADARGASFSSGTPVPAAIVAAASPQNSPMTIADCDVLATIKLHRAWVGLRVDEAALLAMVHRRNEALEAGLFGSAKGMPALHALEVSFRPTMFGSSYSPNAIAQGAPSSATPASPSPSALAAALPAAAGAAPSPFGYIAGVDTPPWTRLVAEVQAVEAFGDVPVLVKQAGAVLASVMTATAETASDDDGGDSSGGDENEGDDALAEDASGTGGEIPPPLTDPSIAPALPASSATATVAKVAAKGVVVSPARAPSLTPLSRDARRKARTVAAQGRAARLAAAAQARAVASAEFSARLSRYLHSEDLRVAINLFVSVLSVPAPPISGLDDEPGDVPGSRATTVGRIDPILQDLAGFDAHHAHQLAALAAAAASAARASGAASVDVGRSGRASRHLLRKVLSLSVSSHHSMQTSIIPEAGSALLSMADSSAAALAATPAQSAQAMAAAALRPAKGAPATAQAPQSPAPQALPRAPPSSQAPVISAPAVAVDVQLSLLTLLEDLIVVRAALDTATAMS